MPTIRSRSRVAAPVATTFAFFDDPANLARLTPPPMRMRAVRVDPSPPGAGTIIELRYGLGPFQRAWVIRLVEHVPGERIVDETLAGPMRRFHHAHTFAAARGGGTWVEDRIDYHVGPDGLVGVVVDLGAGLLLRAAFLVRRAIQGRILRA